MNQDDYRSVLNDALELSKIVDRLREENARWKRDHSDMEAWGKENLEYAGKLRTLLASAREALVDALGVMSPYEVTKIRRCEQTLTAIDASGLLKGG